MYRRIILAAVGLVGCMGVSYAQPHVNPRYPITETRFMHVGLLPGLSTNGLDPSMVENLISIQILAGMSGAQRLIEIAGLSTFTVYSVTGIQLAGVMNVVGGNYLLGMSKEEKLAMQQRGYRPATKAVQMAGAVNLLRTPFTGFQAAGGVNLVVEEVEGAQLAGLGNANGDYLVGFQGAGLFNYVKKFGMGVQLSGLCNWTDRDFDGFQISAGYNQTKLLGGIQIGLVNRSKRVTGWGSPEEPRFKSAQIGLVNITKDQDSFQVGLLNFYRRGSRGVSLGLLNIGGPRWFSSYANERHLFNLEIATGNTITEVLHHTQKWWSTYNTVGFSTVGWYGKTREITWGMGADLTFKQGYFLRSTLRMYYPWEKGGFRDWQGVYGSLGVGGGFIPIKKFSLLWLFVSPTLNWHMWGPVEGLKPPAVALPINDQLWGGLQVGIVLG